MQLMLRNVEEIIISENLWALVIQIQLLWDSCYYFSAYTWRQKRNTFPQSSNGPIFKIPKNIKYYGPTEPTFQWGNFLGTFCVFFSLTLMPNAYWPLCSSTIMLIGHSAHWPLCSLAIILIDHCAHQPSCSLTINPSAIWSSFATFKPFS